MANSQLIDKRYKIPSNILNHIKKALIAYPNEEGIRRAKFLLKNGVITYQVLERLNHFFEHFNSKENTKGQYNLAGGDKMKAFVEQTLESDRNAVKTAKSIKQDMSVDVNLGTKAYNITSNVK